MRAHSRTRKRLSGAWVLGTLMMIIGIAISALKGVTVAHADTITVPATQTVYAVGGATIDGSHPADTTEGDTVVKWVDSPIRPLSMVADNAAAEKKLVQEVTPDANGECNVAGVSSGSVVAYNAARQLASRCATVNLTLYASPIGPGSIQSMLPDTPIAQFPQLPLPTNVHARHIVWDGDGYASCPGWQDAPGCAAGIAVYHYGVAGDPQEIAPPSEYTANGQEYTVKHGPNAVGVLLGAAVKAIDPNFKGWNAVDEARFNQMFPKGTPGYDQPGALTLQGAPNFMAPIENALGGLVKSPVGTAIPQAQAIPAQLNAGTGNLLVDGVNAATSVAAAATSVVGVAAAAQTGNPLGLLQAPAALSNTLTAVDNVGKVVNDLAAGIQAPSLVPTPAIAHVDPTPAPAVDPVPAPVQEAAQPVYDAAPAPVQAVVDQVLPGAFDHSSDQAPAPAPVSVPQVDLGAQVQSAVTTVANAVGQVLGGGNAAPADSPAPAPAAPAPADLVHQGLSLLGVR